MAAAIYNEVRAAIIVYGGIYACTWLLLIATGQL